MTRRLSDEPPAFLTRQPPAWVAGYIGLPFKPRGRDRDGLDCWGLKRLVYEEQYGIALPAYVGGYEGTSRADATDIARLIAGGKPAWQAVPEGAERLGDGIELRAGGVPHVGIVVAAGWMLHIVEGIESAIERYDGPKWKPLGFYRWRGDDA